MNSLWLLASATSTIALLTGCGKQNNCEAVVSSVVGISAIDLGKDGRELVRVEYSYRIDDSKGKEVYTVSDGYLVCDPLNDWVLAEYGGVMKTIAVDVKSHDVPKEEFFLSHYGLPEPNFGRAWNSGWAWLLICAIGCFVIGVVLLRSRAMVR